MSMELWDSDTGELVCRNDALYGTGSSRVADEKAYVVGIPPCLWGSKEEARPALLGSWDTFSRALPDSNEKHSAC